MFGWVERVGRLWLGENKNWGPGRREVMATLIDNFILSVGSSQASRELLIGIIMNE